MRFPWFLAVTVLASISPAQAQFAGITFFGDSNTDSGRYLYLPEVKGNPATFATFGGYTTNPGPMWSTALGSFFGYSVTPSDAPGGGKQRGHEFLRQLRQRGVVLAGNDQSVSFEHRALVQERQDRRIVEHDVRRRFAVADEIKGTRRRDGTVLPMGRLASGDVRFPLRIKGFLDDGMLAFRRVNRPCVRWMATLASAARWSRV